MFYECRTRRRVGVDADSATLTALFPIIRAKRRPVSLGFFESRYVVRVSRVTIAVDFATLLSDTRR